MIRWWRLPNCAVSKSACGSWSGCSAARPWRSRSSSRRPAERAVPDRPADPELTNVRLTGIIVEPDRRTVIFAVQGAKPLVRSEGETVNDWHFDSIAPHEVTLTCPVGTTTLELKSDPNLVRPAPQAQPPPQPKPLQARYRPAARRAFLPMRRGRGTGDNPR